MPLAGAVYYLKRGLVLPDPGKKTERKKRPCFALGQIDLNVLTAALLQSSSGIGSNCITLFTVSLFLDTSCLFSVDPDSSVRLLFCPFFARTSEPSVKLLNVSKLIVLKAIVSHHFATSHFLQLVVKTTVALTSIRSICRIKFYSVCMDLQPLTLIPSCHLSLMPVKQRITM